jgi:hypothetical protein
MRHFLPVIVCLMALPLLAAAPPRVTAVLRPPPGAVVMRPAPGTARDATARRLVAADLAEAAKAGETPLLLVGAARLGRPKDREALFVQLQSARECGSSGCSTSAFVDGPRGWHRVLDAATGPIVVAPQRHRGMHDLLVGRHDRWVWTGFRYADTRPAPALHIRRNPRATQATRPPVLN